MHNLNLSKRVWRDPVYFLAFGFGSGLSPVAPGTFGTLVAIPLYLLLFSASPWVYMTLVVIAFMVGVWASEIVCTDLGEDDYSGIVWDEIVGYLLTMFLVPFSLYWIIIGFILFRFFDILKPWPIRLIERKIKGGFGVMLDDVLAAIPAWIILQFLIWGFSS